MPNPDPASTGPARSYDFSLPTLAAKDSPAPLRLEAPGIASLVSTAFFVLCGCLFLPLLGFEAGEVRYLYDLWHPTQAADSIRLQDHLLPNMLTATQGALKSWLYLPILGLFGSSVLAVRLPMLLLAAVTIALTGKLLRRIQGKTAAAIAVLLLSTDVVFLLAGVFDQNLAVTQNFLLVAGLLCAFRWHDAGRRRFAFLTGLAFGLALWNYAIFAWTLGGMSVAFFVVARPLLLRIWNGKAATLLGFGLCVGACPVLLFNIRTGGATLKSGTHPDFSAAGASALNFVRAINGTAGPAAPAVPVDLSTSKPDRQRRPFSALASSLANHLGAAVSSWRFPAGVLLIAVGLLLGTQNQRKWILFFLLSGIIGWLPLALTSGSALSLGNAALFWIPWYASVALAAGCIAAWRPSVSPRIVAYASALFALIGAINVLVNYGDLLRHSAATPWTDADAALASRLSALGAGTAVITDGGVANALAVRSRNQIAVREQGFGVNSSALKQGDYTACQPPGCWFVTHVPGKETTPRPSLTVENSPTAAAFVRGTADVISDTHGTPTFIVFTEGATAPLPSPAEDGQAALTATPPLLPAGVPSGRITISWRVPAAMAIEVHADAPNGPLFAAGIGPGQSQTGPWAKNGSQFFLQDVTGGKPRTPQNTVAHLVVGAGSK